jgi:trigger factor
MIQTKLDEKLVQMQSEVSLKGFRPGKVPSAVIKSQFGKSIYGEVIDKLLKESSIKALEEKKIKAASQPKIDLKTFGEGKDLNYEMQVDSLPEIELKSFQDFKATEFKVKIDKKILDKKITEIATQHKHFTEKKETDIAKLGDQVIFDYSATVDGNKFEGSEGKGVQLELGKDLFLKGFDSQLVGVKKNQIKAVNAILPSNHPKKELADKKTLFECKILNVKKPEETKIDDQFAKHLGAKNLEDLKKLVENQISSQYNQALNAITKKEILDQLEKSHEVTLPQSLVDNEMASMTQNLSKEDAEKHKSNNLLLAQSRIKLGLLLNEFGEKNNLKVSDDEVKMEIQKQIKAMPGQEKMVMDYYQKNPSAAQSLKGGLYEDKIINLLKTKITLVSKDLNTSEAEKKISEFNKPSNVEEKLKKEKPSKKIKDKTKKISKK